MNVLLLHGGGVASWMWRPLISRLHDCRVIAPDLPGHGANDDTYVSHAKTIEALQLTEKVSVIGFSLGAQLAVQLAATLPELVERVMVISAQTKPMPMADFTLKLLGVTAPLAKQRWFAKLQARQLFIPDALMDDYVATSARVSRETLLASVRANFEFTPPEGWSRFRGPAEVLVGAREPKLMLESARVLHDALPTSALEVVPDVGHGLPLQRPDWLAERVQRWLLRAN